MKRNDPILAAVILGASLILFGLIARNGLLRIEQGERVVAVKGLAEMEVAADKAIWPLAYKEVGDNLSTLYRTLETKNATIVAFLLANGLTEAEISVSAPQIVDLEADRYASANPIRYRYNATSVVTVTSARVDTVRALIARQGEMIAQGIAVMVGDYQYTVQYLYNGLNDIKPQMIARATENARQAAGQFASDSHSKLGRIKTASQGQFTISDVDATTPYRKNVRVVSTVQYYLKD